MNFRLLSHTMGYILWVEAGFLLLPALTACIYAETCWQQFLLTAGMVLLTLLLLSARDFRLSVSLAL